MAQIAPAIQISNEQRDSADFYGSYFWKDYRIEAKGHLDFIIRGIGIEHLERAHTLLDIGAGSGKFSILLKKRFPHLQITAVDLSRDNIDTMHKNTEQAGADIEIRQASATALPFEDNAFDLVLCVYMLQHTDDPKRGFDESVRVLKPGGTAFYTIGRANGLGWIHRHTRWFFTRIPSALRMASIWPVFPFYWSLVHLTKCNKASYQELRKDLVDWIYNPLQNFVPERDIRAWFEQNNLAFEHLGYTGLFKSMMLSRGQKP